jgi:uridine phosphorylase
VLERYSQRIFAALPAMPAQAHLRGGARELIHRYLRQAVQAHDLPELHRQLFVAVRNDPDFEALIQRWEQEAVRRLEQDLRSLSGLLRVSDLRTAAVLLQGTLQAMIQRTTVSRTAVKQERLVRELADMFHRYLFAGE